MTKEQCLNNYIDHILSLPIRIDHFHNEFDSHVIDSEFQIFWIETSGDQSIVVANNFYLEVRSFTPHIDHNVLYDKIKERINIYLRKISNYKFVNL